jgi:hypothetical protein
MDAIPVNGWFLNRFVKSRLSLMDPACVILPASALRTAADHSTALFANRTVVSHIGTHSPISGSKLLYFCAIALRRNKFAPIGRKIKKSIHSKSGINDIHIHH